MASPLSPPPPDPGVTLAGNPATSRSGEPADPLRWPVDLEWRAVSPRLTGVRRAGLLVPALVIAAAVVASALLSSWVWLPWLTGIAGAAALVWCWRLIGRSVRAWGYGERADDLLVQHGVLTRRLSVVPYGRMQFVDVQAGPLERAMGLATVTLHTAAAASDARIPGLPATEAARLRDRLAALGEARAAGL